MESPKKLGLELLPPAQTGGSSQPSSVGTAAQAVSSLSPHQEELFPLPSAPRSHALYLPSSPQGPREALPDFQVTATGAASPPGNGSLMQSRLLELRGPRPTSLS